MANKTVKSKAKVKAPSKTINVKQIAGGISPGGSVSRDRTCGATRGRCSGTQMSGPVNRGDIFQRGGF